MVRKGGAPLKRGSTQRRVQNNGRHIQWIFTNCRLIHELMVNFCEFAETFPIFSDWALSRAGLRDLYVYINSQLSVFRIWILKMFSLTQRGPRQLWANEKWKNSWKKKSFGQLMPVCITLVQLWLRKSLSRTYAPMEWKWRRRGDIN